MLAKPWVKEMQDTACVVCVLCAVCPVLFGSEHLENKSGGIEDLWPRESCMRYGTSWLLVSDIHDTETVLQYIADACSPKCCLLRRKFKSQNSENKAQIFSVCFRSHCSSFSFSLPSLSLPWLLLFQLLLRFPFILSIPVNSTGPSFHSPGPGGSFPVLSCTAELKRPSHCLSPTIPHSFWYFTPMHSASFSPSKRTQHFLASEERMNKNFSRIFTCWTSVMLRTQLSRKVLQELLFFLELDPHACREREDEQDWGWLFVRMLLRSNSSLRDSAGGDQSLPPARWDPSSNLHLLRQGLIPCEVFTLPSLWPNEWANCLCSWFMNVLDQSSTDFPSTFSADSSKYFRKLSASSALCCGSEVPTEKQKVEQVFCAVENRGEGPAWCPQNSI